MKWLDYLYELSNFFLFVLLQDNCNIYSQMKSNQKTIIQTSGDSLVLHCASLLRTIFASLPRANERARVQNVRDFPQTKLGSKINAISFLLNEHGDPHFLFYKFNENNIPNS